MLRVTLDKHDPIIGLSAFTVKTMPENDFVELLQSAGYSLSSTMPSGKNDCTKLLFSHKKHKSVMAVLNPKNRRIVTAYQLT